MFSHVRLAAVVTNVAACGALPPDDCAFAVEVVAVGITAETIASYNRITPLS